MSAAVERKAAAGIAPGPKKRAKATEEEMYGGDLEDVWNTPHEPSRRWVTYKEKFAKHDHINVKAVIKPRGGQSYNPTLKDHGLLLKDAAKAEEAIIEK